MKTKNCLIFEGAGMTMREENDVGNYRIRSRFTNNSGNTVYLEITSCYQNKHDESQTFTGMIQHLEIDGIRQKQEGLIILYSVASILTFVNHNLHCSFKTMRFLSDVFVHETPETILCVSNKNNKNYP